MSEEIKPCPFCGGEVYSSNAGSVWFVHCKSNSCYGGNYELYRSEEAAYEAWNKRSANRESFDAGWEYHKLLDSSQARLSEAVKVLEEASEHIETLSELLKVIKESWIDYDHVFSIAVHEADQWIEEKAKPLLASE